MKRAILVTGHYLESKRKAGFHWLGDALWRAGWDVTFFTQSISWLSWLRRDQRFGYPIFQEAHRRRQVRERLASYVWLTPFHPTNLRLGLLNYLSSSFFRLYGQLSFKEMEADIAAADLFVFDSDHGLLLFDRFRALNPHARYVYRVSDDIPMMRNHPVLLETEARVAGQFDLVSVPSEYILRRFEHLPNVVLQKHGLRQDLFDRPCANPYQGAGPVVVYAGREYFDDDFLRRALRLLPDWSFHVLGDIAKLPAAPNLQTYGELPFEETIPFLKHADIGLQARAYSPGAECLTDSLKMHQYTYCRLPIVAPEFLRHERRHVFYYRPGDDASIHQALLDARHFDRSRISRDGVHTWDDVIRTMTGERVAAAAA